MCIARTEGLTLLFILYGRFDFQYSDGNPANICAEFPCNFQLFLEEHNLNSNILVTSLQDQKVTMLLATQKAGRLPSFSLPAQLHENGPEATSIVWLDWCRSFGGTRGQRARSEILAGVLFMDGFGIRDPTRASDWGHLEKSLPPNIKYPLATLVSSWICLPCWGIYNTWRDHWISSHLDLVWHLSISSNLSIASVICPKDLPPVFFHPQPIWKLCSIFDKTTWFYR